MTITLNLSPELVDTLQKMAEAGQLSLDDLVESAVTQYVVDRQDVLLLKPSIEEIETVKASFLAAEQPNAKWHSTAQVKANVKKLLAGKKIKDFDLNKDEADDWQM